MMEPTGMFTTHPTLDYQTIFINPIAIETNGTKWFGTMMALPALMEQFGMFTTLPTLDYST
ncbi:MAG: hypothetical protein IPN58_18330 [Anaerolineales bacterium]|nr:hypothetical protein [Anaerolineales bacterium]